MEKGAYRIKAPVLRRTPSKLRQTPAHNAFSPYEKKVAFLVFLLVVATIVSFGTAYYLFTTRWEHDLPATTKFLPDDHYLSEAHGTTSSSSSIPIPNTISSVDEKDSSSEKFLSYLPHSGFHNQRIAFENALVLARITNRTLLMPPVRLGQSLIRGDRSYDQIYNALEMSGKEGLFHCSLKSSKHSSSPECFDYFNYTLVPWDLLVDLKSIQREQNVMPWRNISNSWLEKVLKVPKNETFVLKNATPYHYRFVDTYPKGEPGSRYLESISISELSRLPHRLIQVGTLFGSSRLRLRKSLHLNYRSQVRRSMVYRNDHLLKVVTAIQVRLGGVYIAAHIRLRDGIFAENGPINVRHIWWKLVNENLEINEGDTLQLEMETMQDPTLRPPIVPIDLAALRVPHPEPERIIPNHHSALRCRNPLHNSTNLSILNIPLFISTDVSTPKSHPLLRLFYETFPCTFTLADFPKELALLDDMKNDYDGLPLREFMLPFLDAMIAGKAYHVVGTEGSTFSHFVEDILWRQYHGWDIVQRG